MRSAGKSDCTYLQRSSVRMRHAAFLLTSLPCRKEVKILLIVFRQFFRFAESRNLFISK